MVTTIVNLSLPVGDPNRIINIQGYQAESYSETPSQPNFDPIEIGGRSSPIAYYNGGSARTVSFSMLFHRDMIAPNTSAVYYSGMPGGIEGDGSQYAGLYLGPNSEPATTQELRAKFIRDYLYYHDTYLTGAKINDQPVNLYKKYVEGTSLDTKTGKTYKVIDFAGNGKRVAVYDKDGVFLGFEEFKTMTYKGYKTAWNEQNLKGEADATARFHIFINKLKALNYPIYNTNGVIPPKVYLKIGGDENSGLGGIRLKGYCTTNINYDGIVKHNSLISAMVDFSFTEVVDIAWSGTEVINGMERYVQWMDPVTR